MTVLFGKATSQSFTASGFNPILTPFSSFLDRGRLEFRQMQSNNPVSCEGVAIIVLQAAEADSPGPSSNLVAVALRRLRSSPYLPVRSVSCELRQGVLCLRGRLPNYYLKQIAQETVATLGGVVRIDNAIEVR